MFLIFIFIGLGYCAVIVSATIGLYYNVIIGYCFFYFFASMSDPLPWTEDSRSFNSSNMTGIYVSLLIKYLGLDLNIWTV